MDNPVLFSPFQNTHTLQHNYPPPLLDPPPPLRYTFLLDLALQHNQPLLMVGPTGTGKSVYMNRHLVQVRGAESTPRSIPGSTCTRRSRYA